MRSRERWPFTVGAMLLAAGCSSPAAITTSTEAAAPITTLPRTTTTGNTSTTQIITTTSAAATTTTIAVRLPDNDVDDPAQAIVAILDYVSYLHSIPEVGPEYLGLVYLETCDCYDAVLGYLAEYAGHGWVQDDAGIEVTDVVISQEFGNGSVLLQVTETWAPQFVRDAVGDRRRLESDEFIDKVVLFGLERSDDGRWRVAVTGRLGEVTEIP